jgi:dynein heavy chain
MAAGNRSF